MVSNNVNDFDASIVSTYDNKKPHINPYPLKLLKIVVLMKYKTFEISKDCRYKCISLYEERYKSYQAVVGKF